MNPNVVDSAEGITQLLQEVSVGAKRIAVLGIKTEAQSDQPAFYVPKYCLDAGFDVVPVPVYYPEATSILGREVHRRLVDVPGPIDMVNVFRRSRDLAAHLDDILDAKPKCVWLQSGIEDAAFAEKLAAAGIKVVQDHCLMVELRQRPALAR